MNEEKIRYLERLFDNEEDRRNTLDGKLSTLVGQNGIVFTISSLILPFLYERADKINIHILIFIGFIYILISVVFILSILYSSQIFNIGKYGYMNGTPDTVLKYESDDEFKKEELKDLIKSIEYNADLNNKKGTLLIKSGKLFTFGISMISLIIILSLIGVFTMKHIESEIKISNQIKTDKIETSLQETNAHFKNIENIFHYNRINIKTDSIKK